MDGDDYRLQIIGMVTADLEIPDEGEAPAELLAMLARPFSTDFYYNRAVALEEWEPRARVAELIDQSLASFSAGLNEHIRKHYTRVVAYILFLIKQMAIEAESAGYDVRAFLQRCALAAEDPEGGDA